MASDGIEPPAALTNWWPGDATAVDIAGGKNGTLHNGARFSQGVDRSAFKLDGVDDFVEVPRLSLLTGLTFEVWVKTTSNTVLTHYDVEPALMILGDSNGGWNSFGVEGGLPQYSYYGLSQSWGWQSITATTPVNDGNWHHLAVTHDLSGDIALYVDGVVEGTGIIQYVPDNTTIDRIGAGYLDQNGFNGLLDEVSVYNRVLRAGEIQAVFDAGKIKPDGGGGDYGEGPPLPDGIVDRWTGNGSAIDVIGGSNGTLHHGARFAQGLNDSAFNFDGLDDFVEIPTVSLPTGLSFEVWVKTTSNASIMNYPGDSAQTILGVGGDEWINFGIQGGLARYSYYGLSDDWRWQSVMAETPINDGNWHHVAVTHSLSGSIHLYVDGVLEGTGEIRYAPNNTTIDRIGAAFQERSVFDGLLDELSIYDRALNADEIQAVFNAESNGNVMPAGISAPASDLADWWAADGDATDQAGGNNGVLQGNAMYGPGIIGAAFSLAGDRDYLEIPRIALPTGLTYEVWLKTDNAGSGLYNADSSCLTILGDSSNSVWNNFCIQDGLLRYDHYGNQQGWQWLSVVGQTQVNDGNWHHVAVTHAKTGNITLYVDGVVDGAGNIAYSSANTAIDRIGAGYANHNAFSGQLDEVSVYKRALSASEIQAVYRAGNSGTGGVRFIGNRDFSAATDPHSISDTFGAGAGTWHVYDYNGGIHAGENVTYSVTWEGSGGVNDSPYVWGDDSRWRIDTPETPNSILPFYYYRIWTNDGKVDLRQANVSVSLRGDHLNLHGAQVYFWVLGGSTAISRWHFTSQPINVGDGVWDPAQTLNLIDDESLWTHTFAADPLQPNHSLDDVLRNVHSYGFSFVGFSEEVTGKFSMDDLLLTNVGFRQEAPHIEPSSGVTDYAENSPPQIIDCAITIADYDSPDFDIGKLVIDFALGGAADDRLAIRNVGTGSGQIGISGSNVTFQGFPIGSFTGGVGTTPLVVRFNANATVAAVRALLQGVTYENLSDNPTANRSVRFVMTDGDSGTSAAATKVIHIVPANDAPLIRLPGESIVLAENDPATIIDAGATVSDVDSFDFDSGTLTVDIASNGTADDRLSIRNDGTGSGRIGLSNAAVLFEGTVIGNFTGGIGTTPLVVTFHADASILAVQSLLRGVTYENLSDNPTVERSVRFVLTDGDGGTSNVATKLIHIVATDDVLFIRLSDGAQTYVENNPATIIDANAIVSDPDSFEIAFRTLTADLGFTGTPNDHLAIRNVGTGSGQIGISGSNITYQGSTIGSFTGGIGSTPLVVSFNANVSVQAVQALLREVTFQNSSDNPGGDRSVNFVITIGKGQTSNTAIKRIHVISVNDAPVISLPGGTLNYQATDPPKIIDGNATVSDLDSFDFDSGTLTIDFASGGTADDLLAIRDQGSGPGQISVGGVNVLYQGTVIGAFTKGTGANPFVVHFNANASVNAVQMLLRNVTYRSVSNNPASNRTVRFQLTDGDGGASNKATKLIHVIPFISVLLSSSPKGSV